MSENKQLVIDHRMVKLLVGIIALSLANVTSYLSNKTILSISESYHYGGWAHDFFVGSLFVIAALMASYNGYGTIEKILAKVAAFAALLVALFPCECGTHDQVIPKLHAISAATMFLVLVALCYIFYLRAKAKPYVSAKRRAKIYMICGIFILLSIAILVANHLLSDLIINRVPRLVYYCEKTGLIAFGVAWLSASHLLPFITDPSERWFVAKPQPL